MSITDNDLLPIEETNENETPKLRIGMHTFGCRSNYADTVDIQAALVDSGAHPCEVEDDADVYVLNTCTVTDSADKDLFKLVRKIRRQKPDAKILVTGCMAEARGEELALLPEIAAVVGPGRREELVRGILQLGGNARPPDPPIAPLIARSVNPGVNGTEGAGAEDLLVQLPRTPVLVARVHPSGRRVKKSLPRRHSISLVHPISKSISGPGESLGDLANRARFHLRVQEGCENSCTFCIIPSTRGRLSSRSIDLILKDIEHLAEVGYQEIVLTGTHLGGWGEDIGSSLSNLLTRLGRDSAISRIRLSSIDPNDLGDKEINCLVKYPVFCNHLHICFQAFSERTLKRMNRKYGLDEAVSLLNKVVDALPGCAIGSDVIAGFPGESREELEEGTQLFLHLPISYLHVFPYSERSGTAAVRLDGSVAPSERKRRAARWRAVAQRKKDAYLQGLVGKELEVVCERLSDKSAFGTSREFASCEIPFNCFNEPTPQTPSLGAILRVHAVSYRLEQGEIRCELLNPEN